MQNRGSSLAEDAVNLAEIKAAAEAATRRPYPHFQEASELRTHRAWLVERVEELAEALREVEEWDSRAAARHGNLGVREFARDVRARLENE